MPRKMTQAKALAEAKKRWGKNACITERTNAITAAERAAILAKPREQRTKEEQTNAGCSWRCTVGKIVMGMFNEVQGQGDTWEEAFAKADENARREKERWEQIKREREQVQVK